MPFVDMAHAVEILFVLCGESGDYNGPCWLSHDIVRRQFQATEDLEEGVSWLDISSPMVALMIKRMLRTQKRFCHVRRTSPVGHVPYFV